MSEYSWSDTDAANQRRLAAIAASMDPGTFELLELLGVGPGWRCAEIGAGVGTVVQWLTNRVGATGRVLATDLDTTWITDLVSPVVEVRIQDIAQEPPEVHAFDLAHARTVLTHVRDCEQAAANMVAALRPGGWLFLEETDLSATFGRSCPTDPAYQRFVDGLRVMIEKSGGDPDLGRTLPTLVHDLGLTDVGAHVRLLPGTPEAMSIQLDAAGEILVSLGVMPAEELKVVRAFVENPAHLLYGPLIVSAWGRKPA